MSSYDFNTGPLKILPSNAFATAICKAMAPAGFFAERETVYKEFGTPLHDKLYQGHEGEGEPPSKFLQGLVEFSNRYEQIDMSAGKVGLSQSEIPDKLLRNRICLLLLHLYGQNVHAAHKRYWNLFWSHS